MSENIAPPSPSGRPSPPSFDAPASADDGANVAAADPGPSNDVDVLSGAAQPLSLASSSSSVPSPSSSQQPSPSPAGGAKYENTKELRNLREKLDALGQKGNWTEQSELLRNSDSTFVKFYPLLEELLVNLNPAHTTAAYVYIINFMVDVALQRKQERDMMRTTQILKNYVETRQLVKEQLEQVIDIYASLFRKITKFIIQKEEYVNGIPFLSMAIDTIVDPSEQTVTTLHGCLFTLCLKAHAIGHGLKYLHPYIKSILPEHNPSSGVPSMADSRALLTYLYYGALLTARATDWKRSTALLKAACYVPGYAVSEIQIEALKKLHIISFIAYGTVTMPTRSPNLAKAFKSSGTMYAHMAAELEGSSVSDWDEENRSYSKGDNEPLSTAQIAERAKIVGKYLKANADRYVKDQNTELMLILQHECKLRAVLKVAEVYKVASLARITEMAKLENVEETKEILTALVDRGRLLVSPDGDDFVLLELPTVPQSLDHITARQQKLVEITEDVKKLDLQAKKTPYYMQRTNKAGGHPNDDEGLSMSNIPENFTAPSAPTSVPT